MNQNAWMRKLLFDHDIETGHCHNELDQNLQDLLSDGIERISDCFFIRKLIPEDFNIDIAIEQSFDKTELECDVNHIHIDDFLTERKQSEATLLKQGVCYANQLSDLLSKIGGFEIIVAFVNDPILDCNIRFHKIRPNEEWVTGDLYQYEEAILTIEV